MPRAYSLLTLKSVDDDQRILEGIASTPTPDRAEDVVEPAGAKFTLPMPLLWQHNARQPIGHVTKARVTREGIAITAQVAKGVLPYIDEAWALIKSGLVRGLSIGMVPIKSEPVKGSRWGEHYLEWDWMELSAVTIPANADASIVSIKSVDEQHLRAVSGDPYAGRHVVKLTPPGVAGQTAVTVPKGKGTEMKTTKEMITALEATRAAKAAELAEIAKTVTEKGETMDAETGEKFDGLNAEVVSIDKDLKRYRALDEINKASAVAITTETAVHRPAATPALAQVPALSGIRLKANTFPGQGFARMAIALKRSRGNWQDAIAVAQTNKHWMDTTPEMVLEMKAAVAGGDTTTAGWASEVAYATNLASEFIEFLRPMTIVGRIPNLRRVPFNVRMASQTGGSTGYWVGQGKPILVSKLTTSSTSLGITKVAGMVVVDDELVKLSSPSIEQMVRDDLVAELAQTTDDSFINPNNGGSTNIQPASVLFGVTPVTPTGTATSHLIADIKTLFATMIAADVNIGNAVLVMSESTALAISLIYTDLGQFQFPTMSRTGGTLLGWPVIVSNTANISGSPQFGNIIAAINPREIFLADDGGLSVEISREASIEMVDASSQSSTATSTGASLVSMWQTQSEAIKAVHYINWAKRRASAAAFIQAAAYVGG